MKSDHSLKVAVSHALERDPEIDDAAFGVSVHHGIVTLTGTVADWTTKHHVECVAQKVSGVVDLANDIVIESRGCKQRSDAELAESLRTALAAAVDAHAIKIVVDDRSVTLAGSVTSLEARDRAEAVVRQIGGILDLSNELVVR